MSFFSRRIPSVPHHMFIVSFPSKAVGSQKTCTSQNRLPWHKRMKGEGHGMKIPCFFGHIAFLQGDSFVSEHTEQHSQQTELVDKLQPILSDGFLICFVACRLFHGLHTSHGLQIDFVKKQGWTPGVLSQRRKPILPRDCRRPMKTIDDLNMSRHPADELPGETPHLSKHPKTTQGMATIE